jgi:hypothetical protein
VTIRAASAMPSSRRNHAVSSKVASIIVAIAVFTTSGSAPRRDTRDSTSWVADQTLLEPDEVRRAQARPVESIVGGEHAVWNRVAARNRALLLSPLHPSDIGLAHVTNEAADLLQKGGHGP